MAGSVVSTVSSRKGRGLVRVDCALTCASGAVTAAPIGSFYGRIVGIIYEPTAGAGATMTSTADVALTDAVTGASILTDADFGTARLERPTIAIVDNTGTAVTPADTANDTNRDIFVAGKLNLAIANATTTDTGLISLLIEEAV
jgi:hypothetical protein